MQRRVARPSWHQDDGCPGHRVLAVEKVFPVGQPETSGLLSREEIRLPETAVPEHPAWAGTDRETGKALALCALLALCVRQRDESIDGQAIIVRATAATPHHLGFPSGTAPKTERELVGDAMFVGDPCEYLWCFNFSSPWSLNDVLSIC